MLGFLGPKTKTLKKEDFLRIYFLRQYKCENTKSCIKAFRQYAQRTTPQFLGQD